MGGGLLRGLKRFILWDYPRACWQYDVMVALILAFIFLTPRSWFRDQPRPSSVVMLPAEHGTNVYWLEPDLLSDVPPAQRPDKVVNAIRGQTGKRPQLVRLEPIFDEEKEVRGYMAFTKP
ncbi:MAG: hypothetical protein ACE141_18735 [Bryobacteraceae bacterium]